MKKLKKVLAVMLAVVLVATSAGLSLTTKTPVTAVTEPKGSVSKTDGPGAITFYVPETIYLVPVNGNANTFQYYVDCSTSGVLNTQRNKTSGVVYFSCPNADANSISISASGASVSLGATTASGTVLNTTVTGGTLSTAISQGSVSTVTWTVSYRVKGVQMTAKAYSVAYAPPIEPVASVIRTKNNDGLGSTYKAFCQSFAYVAGIQTHDSGDYQARRSSGRIMTPMLNSITAPGGNWGSVDWFDSGSSPKGANYYNLEGGGNNLLRIVNSPWGYVTVDRSRYSDISQIPNLQYGFAITDLEYMRDSLSWYVADYTDGAYKGDATVNQNGGNFNLWWGTPGTGDVQDAWVKDGHLSQTLSIEYGIKVGSDTGGKPMFSKALSAGTGNQDLTIKAAAKANNRDEWNGTVHLLNVRFNKVDKSTLRTNMRNAISRGAQAADYNGNFTNYENAIKAAAESLGNPTTAPISDTINSTFGALTRKTYTAAINHKFDNGASTITENLTFNSGDIVNFSPNTYTYYTLNSADGYTASTAAQSVLYRGNITQNYNFNANLYNLTFNANGGTGGTGPTPTKYGVAITAPTVTRTGYTFNGWSPTVPATMPGANSTYTAQWTINQYTITFNSNGGSAVGSITQNYGTSVAKPADPTRTGYTFAGWYSDSGLTTAVSWPYTMGASNVTFYAKWTVNNYNLTFDANGGTGGSGPTPTPYGAGITAPTVTRTGYTFNGWSPTVPATMPAADSTYTAQWTINQYTITFNSNGGSAVSPITQNYGTSVSKPADPAKTNYDFAGWYSDSGLTTAVTWPYTIGASDVTFYAKWTLKQHTVSFISNGGSAVSPITQNYGTNVAEPAAPTRTGYTFAGWYSDSGLTTAVTWPHNLTADVTFYAKWTINQYTVNFNSNGGSAVGSITQNYNTNVNEPAAPTRTGYIFGGWYSDSGLTNAVTWPYTLGASDVTFYADWSLASFNLTFDANGGSGGSGPTSTPYGTSITAPTVTRTGYTFNGWVPAVPPTMPAADSTYTAQWTINQYTVNFNSNGGSAVNAITQNYNTNVAEPAAPAKTGHTFAGWYSDAGLTTAVTWPYTLGASDVTFYAKWTVNNYNITFDANGGTGGTGPTSMAYGSSLSAPSVSRTGYTFNGWLPEVPATVPDANTTYVAQWQINTYNVNFNANGGSGTMSPQMITFSASSNLKPNEFTRTGYSFTKWNTAADGSGTDYNDGASYGPMGASDVTLYAQWSINQYTVSFNSNGGSAVNAITQNYGTDVTKPADPAKTGYTFAGWYSDSGLTTAVTWPHNLTADVTFYAKWTADPYTISFNSNGGSPVTSITQGCGTDVAEPTPPTKLNYAFAGWYSDAGLTTAVAWPYTMGAANVTFYAKWSVPSINITMDSNNDFIVYISDWESTSEYQIWTYQQVTSDDVLSGDTNVKKDQWILSMPYASGADGNPEPDGSISFNIDGFISSTENYIVAVRIADANGNFVKEIRDAYTPAGVGEAVITKVLVDGTVTTGYELKEIKTGASVDIEVVGNDVANLVYSATVVNGVSPTALTGNGNEFNWDISALQPGIYLIEMSATNGSTTDKKLVEFELYAAAPAVNFGVLNSMAVAYSNGNV
ncbi:MAG: InlB B-repeat-containing protein, partial [Acutalibacteraceae bacterium]